MPTNSRLRWVKIGVVLGRTVLAVIFLVAAYAKMKPQIGLPWSLASVKTSLAMFALQVDSYQMLAPGYVSFVAHLLPPLELFLGLWLLTGLFARFSSVITTLLIAGFFSLTIRTYARGLEISCGCFGPGGKLGVGTIFRDGSFLALALAVAIGTFVLASKRKGGGARAMAAPSTVPLTAGR
jgi:uncharacterized membrane protein YphA (DoxX/SURF4 family)